MKKAFPPVIYPDSKLLILGTMPGEKSLQLQQYYGNRGNQFWKLLFTMFGVPFTESYEARILLLQQKGIAVWDVLKHCERQGSLDSAIKNEEPNDFAAFYKKHPQISHIFFSSKNAERYYDKYVGKKPGLHYDVLPSPSGANASKSFAEKLAVWEQKIMPLVTN